MSTFSRSIMKVNLLSKKPLKTKSIFIDVLLPNPLKYIKNNFIIVKLNFYVYIFLNLPVLLPTNYKKERTVQQIYSLVNTVCAQRIKSVAEYHQNNFSQLQLIQFALLLCGCKNTQMIWRLDHQSN